MSDPEFKNVLKLKKKSDSLLMEEIQDFISKQNTDSLDELKGLVGDFFSEKNNTGIDSFLGISPSQMYLVLYKPFSLQNHLFDFQSIDESQLKEIPIIMQALFVLNKINEIGEIKGTQLGNFPKSFVVDFYNSFLSNERYSRLPNREDDLYQLTRLKHLLELSGIIKKRNNKFSLTKKGERILAQKNNLELFENIIVTWAEDFNWALSDRYPDLELIQRSVVFNLYLIHKLCDDWIEEKEIGLRYLNAFPDLVFETKDFYFEPAQGGIDCFILRFLERFCMPLGLLDQKEEGEFFKNRKVFYRLTPFFKDNFKF